LVEKGASLRQSNLLSSQDTISDPLLLQATQQDLTDFLPINHGNISGGGNGDKMRKKLVKGRGGRRRKGRGKGGDEVRRALGEEREDRRLGKLKNRRDRKNRMSKLRNIY